MYKLFLKFFKNTKSHGSKSCSFILEENTKIFEVNLSKSKLGTLDINEDINK